MSDLTATNCGSGCGCNDGSVFGGNNNILFIFLLLFCCGGCGCNGSSIFGGSNGCGCESIIIILLLLSCCGGGCGFGCN